MYTVCSIFMNHKKINLIFQNYLSRSEFEKAMTKDSVHKEVTI